mgnify:CR=1 FL=1
MKKAYKIIGVVAVILTIIGYLISTIINLVLNKKYAVDQIKYTERKQGLEGIQEIVTEDYINTIYLIFYHCNIDLSYCNSYLSNEKNK